MGGGQRSASSPAPPQHMYFLEGGLLVVGNLLKTDAWVHDEVRTHCNVCVQQFLPFRRRHHCRTCGEVVCGGCSSKREVRLTDVNVQCATRVCTFCMIRATDASIKEHETTLRATLAMDKHRMSIQPVHNVNGGGAQSGGHGGAGGYVPHNGGDAPSSAADNNAQRRGIGQKQLSMWSMDSDLTNGSVIQLWPQPIPDDESARLQIVRNSVILRSENDPTMNLLVNIVSRTLECPVAFIGILDDSFLWFKASVGWDRTHIPRDDCVCSQTLAQAKTMIVADTNVDKQFHANNINIGSEPLRYYAGAPIRVMGQCIGVVCALDSSPHKETSPAMKSTLEAVANIVSEVLEQRVDGSSSRQTDSTLISMDSRSASSAIHPTPSTFHQHYQQHMVASETASDSNSERSSSERSSSSGTDCGGLLDLHASLHRLNLADYVSSQGSSADLEWTDPSPCMYLALSSVPQEYGEKIGVSMDFFQRLQSTLWCERPSQDGVKAFELFQNGRQFTRSNTKLSGTCAEAIAHLQNYENMHIYQNLFSHVTRCYKLSAQTWMDEITFQPNVISAGCEALRVLTHSRQYPDDSTVVVAVNATKIYEAEENDLLFGWFVAPCSLHDGLGAVNVSCIVAQPYENQVLEPNLSCGLTLRLRTCLSPQQQQAYPHHHHHHLQGPMPPTRPSISSRSRKQSVYSDTGSSGNNQHLLSFQDLMHVPAPAPTPAAAVPPPLPSPMRREYRTSEDISSSFDNQRAHEANSSFLSTTRTISEESFTSFSSSNDSSSYGGSSHCVKIVPVRSMDQQQIQQASSSNLNQNERMMLDLLDKTISTQEILAAQQHEMASVIDYHGSQLQRISTAIERVENLLADSGERFKRMPQPKAARHSMY